MLLTNASTVWTIQEIGIIGSIGIALVSLLWSIIHSFKVDKLNAKMIENSTRPIISIYSEIINTGSPALYLVIKNFGNSLARIHSIDDNGEIFKNSGFHFGNQADYLKDLNNSLLAPKQSRIIGLEYKQLVDKIIEFKISYSSQTQQYEDRIVFRVTAGSNIPISKSATKDKELMSISYTLQEFLQKSI